MQPTRRDSDPNIHIARDDDMQEERREESPGRRSTDVATPPHQQHAHGIDWKLILGIAGFVLVIGTTIFTTGRSVAATEQAVKEVTSLKLRLDSIDDKLTKAALEGNSQEKDLAFLRKEFDDFRKKVENDKETTDTWIATTREKMIELKGLAAK